jgi:hypothetical protein
LKDRSAATLIPIIQQWVIPGSTIHSDQWAAYNGLAGLGFNHRTVNHQQNFIDPVTDACTNHVEAFWSRLKRRLKYIAGSVGEMRWSHLDEACYREWYGMKAESVWNNWEVFLTHIHDVYPI